MTCAPSKVSDQPGHPSSLIRVFTVHMTTPWVLGCPLSAQRRLLSDWADAQADLSLRWAHMPFRWFCHEAAQLQLSSFNCFSIFFFFNLLAYYFIGVLAQSTDPDERHLGDTYIPATYIKYIESAGARVVPVRLEIWYYIRLDSKLFALVFCVH